MTKRFNFFCFLAGLLFFLKLTLHLISPLVGPYTGFNDSFVRIIMAVNSNIPNYGQWLPLHIRLLQFSTALYPNIQVSPRIFTLIISLILALVFIRYAEVLYKNRWITLIAVFLFLLNPVISGAFTVPLTEPLFALFFLTGLYYLIKKLPFHSVVFFNLAHMVRYESWYFFPVIILLITRDHWPVKTIIKFSLAYFIFPIYWQLQNYVYTGNPLYFLSDRVNVVQQVGRPYTHPINAVTTWLGHFITHLGIIPFTLLVLARHYRRSFIPILSSVYLVFMLILQILTGTMEWYPQKYVYLPILLLLPAVAAGLIHLWTSAKPSIRYLIFVVVAITVIFWLKEDYYFTAQKYQLPPVAAVIQATGVSRIDYLYPSDKFPYDRDNLIFHSGIRYYNPTEINSQNISNTNYINFNQYGLFDHLDYHQICPSCTVLFQDSDYTFVKFD